MGFVAETLDSIRKTNVRQILLQAVSLGMIVTSALIIWKGLMCFTGSESPVVVVLSGSMEPGFKRGDILFLHMSKAPIRTGEIVVFHVDGREIPIVHRVIKVHERRNTGDVEVLTKGDNNAGDDRLLYAQGQMWLQRHHIMGRAVGFLPYDLDCNLVWAAAHALRTLTRNVPAAGRSRHLFLLYWIRGMWHLNPTMDPFAQQSWEVVFS
ncbi:hypothetical protein AXG93_2982s1110 [Marchantia polymorpha subsp. ruderalis]|uniref:Signal peptidase complex catalytic subunit SEC11 n=1 Tax=Marchantia polymorpha subsp. ruderalis TaxID=1480154 RepID=A0A176VXQ5_MARPO|nr:hypothetical protein AXG93_2982s1110 [Marchantia polymorpha subsp. ruderalis]